MSRETDVAWAAGLFEGEGSITCTYGSHLHLSLSTTDEDVLDRFHRIAGVGNRGGWQGQSPRKYTYQWYADGEDAVEWLTILLPYLGNRRSARANETLAARREYIERVTAPRSCAFCSETFHPRFIAGHAIKKYCSVRCRELARNRRRFGQRRKVRL